MSAAVVVVIAWRLNSKDASMLYKTMSKNWSIVPGVEGVVNFVPCSSIHSFILQA
jgi:hypothetical protein